jgi:hypothetical protein
VAVLVLGTAEGNIAAHQYPMWRGVIGGEASGIAEEFVSEICVEVKLAPATAVKMDIGQVNKE